MILKVAPVKDLAVIGSDKDAFENTLQEQQKLVGLMSKIEEKVSSIINYWD